MTPDPFGTLTSLDAVADFAPRREWSEHDA